MGMRKSVPMYFNLKIMATDSELIEAFSKGLQVREAEVHKLRNLLRRALDCLNDVDADDHDNTAKHVRNVLIEDIKMHIYA